MDIFSALFGTSQANEVTISEEEKVVNYITSSNEMFLTFEKENVKLFSDLFEEINKIKQERKTGAYLKLLDFDVRILKSEINFIKKNLGDGVNSLPYINDQLDEKYHMEALSLPKSYTNTGRRNAKDAALYLEKIIQRLNEFEHNHHLTKELEIIVLSFFKNFSYHRSF